MSDQLQRLGLDVLRKAVDAPPSHQVAPSVAVDRALGGHTGRRKRKQFFLELFSGSGHLSQGIRRHGLTALEWDISRGANGSLLQRRVQRQVRGLLLAGHVWGVHLGTPCNSFSRVRDRRPPAGVHHTGHPGRLRSDGHPGGLPHLVNAKDLAAVRTGNELARFSLSILELCRLHEIHVTIENPQSSRLWILPGFKKLRNQPGYQEAIIHTRHWGRPWKKPMRVGAFMCDLRPLEIRCRGRAVCDRTGRPHQGLSGKAPDGRWWTRVAEAYPRSLADTWAGASENGCACKWLRRISSVCL